MTEMTGWASSVIGSWPNAQHILSFDANISPFSLAESPPRDQQITVYK